VKELSTMIDETLKDRDFIVVFGNQLEVIYTPDPDETKRRNDAIRAFADARHLTATINDSGVRVTFRKKSP
jgi:hypothetical protein